jgi:hypothetical protein
VGVGPTVFVPPGGPKVELPPGPDPGPKVEPLPVGELPGMPPAGVPMAPVLPPCIII